MLTLPPDAVGFGVQNCSEPPPPTHKSVKMSRDHEGDLKRRLLIRLHGPDACHTVDRHAGGLGPNRWTPQFATLTSMDLHEGQVSVRRTGASGAALLLLLFALQVRGWTI